MAGACGFAALDGRIAVDALDAVASLLFGAIDGRFGVGDQPFRIDDVADGDLHVDDRGAQRDGHRAIRCDDR